MHQSKCLHGRFSQQGFTLIELVIALIVLGLLAIVASRQFGSGVGSNSQGEAMYASTQKMADNWALLSSTSGTGNTVAGSSLPSTTACSGACIAIDVLILGNSAVANAYKAAYIQAGLAPLTDSAQGANGTYTIAGYPITFGGGGAAPFSAVYSGVPDSVTQYLVKKYGSGVSPLAASDISNGVIRYSVSSSNSRTVTIIKQQ